MAPKTSSSLRVKPKCFHRCVPHCRPLQAHLLLLSPLVLQLTALLASLLFLEHPSADILMWSKILLFPLPGMTFVSNHKITSLHLTSTGSFLKFYPLELLMTISQFSHTVMSNSLRPHEPQHALPPCPSPTPGVHPNPCSLSR